VCLELQPNPVVSISTASFSWPAVSKRMQPVRGSGLDTNESAIEDDETTNESPTGPPIRRVFGRVSFDQNPSQHRPSFTARWRSVLNPDVEPGPNGSQANERPPIPSALQVPEVPTTPLPTLSMVVLSIVSVTLSSRTIPQVRACNPRPC
jgi:hypothetical protein